MATSMNMGLLSDLFGGGNETGMEEYLTPAQQSAMSRQALLQAAMAIGQASGPSTTPRSLMQILSSGVSAGQQGYAEAQKNAITQLLTKQKLDEYKRQKAIEERLGNIFTTQAPVAGMPITPQQALAAPGGQVGPTVERAAMIGQTPEGAAVSPEDMRYEQYMRAAQLFAADPTKAKAYMDMALAIKPREEVTGQPFEVTGTDGLPVMVQQFKGGKIKTLEGFGPKREVVLQNVDGRIMAIDKNALKGGEVYGTGITPAEQQRLEMDAKRYGLDVERLKMERQRLGMEVRRLNMSEAEFKRGQYERVETADGLVYVPKVPGLPVIPIAGPTGEQLTGKGGATEDQSKAAGFALRMGQATQKFNQPVLDPNTNQPLVDASGKPITLEKAFGTPSKTQSILRNIPSAGITTGIANVFESSGRQQYRQAQEDWVTANLRAESGAAIGVDEMDKEIQKYFPQTNDKPETIAQKAQSRKAAELAMQVRGGPALKAIQKSQRQPQAGGVGRLVTDPATGVTRYVEGN